MAFRKNNVAPFGNNSDESWKADGFINLYLPTKGGTKRKLGAISLKSTKPNEADLIKFLESDPSSAIQKLRDLLIVEYNSAEGSEDAAFALG